MSNVSFERSSGLSFLAFFSSLSPLLAFTDADGWRLGIGDPTLGGWITVIGYFTAGSLALKAAFRVSTHGIWSTEEGRFYTLLGLGLILLGLNKQLDLQTLLTLTGRKIALAQGWYEKRRIVQMAFIGVIAVIGLLSFRWAWKALAECLRHNWLTLLGIVFVITFVLIRAASIHHIDHLLKINIAGLRINWILELGGIGMIIAGILRELARLQNPAVLSDHAVGPPAAAS